MGFVPFLKKTADKVTTAKNKRLQKTKARVKKATSKVKVVTKKIKGGVKQRLSNIAKSKGFIVLAPYKQVMRAILKKRGHAVSNSASIQVVATMFNDVVIKGKAHFDYNYYNKLQHVSEVESGLAAKGLSYGLQVATGGTVSSTATVGIIQNILNWFKNIGNKKAQGQALSEEETLAAEEDEKIEAKGEIATTEDKNFFERLFDALFPKRNTQHLRRRIDARNKPVIKSNIKASSKVTAPVSTAKLPIVNSTEAVYSQLASAKVGAMQNVLGRTRGTVRAATDSVNTHPVSKKYPPNSWVQTPHGWHWANASGKLI